MRQENHVRRTPWIGRGRCSSSFGYSTRPVSVDGCEVTDLALRQGNLSTGDRLRTLDPPREAPPTSRPQQPICPMTSVEWRAARRCYIHTAHSLVHRRRLVIGSWRRSTRKRLVPSSRRRHVPRPGTSSAGASLGMSWAAVLRVADGEPQRPCSGVEAIGTTSSVPIEGFSESGCRWSGRVPLVRAREARARGIRRWHRAGRRRHALVYPMQRCVHLRPHRRGRDRSRSRRWR